MLEVTLKFLARDTRADICSPRLPRHLVTRTIYIYICIFLFFVFFIRETECTAAVTSRSAYSFTGAFGGHFEVFSA